MHERVVALLGDGLVDPDAPLLRADDLGTLRGDGVFETILVVDRMAVELDAHLTRLARSAAILDLPAPDLHRWRSCAQTVIDAWSGDREMVLKLILTRGVEGHDAVTGYAIGAPVSPAVLAQRRDGVAVVTLTRGTAPDLAVQAPWLLLGAKTLSYAMNMAAVRHAERLGAQDVVFTAAAGPETAAGSVLEGPTSTVVIARDNCLYTPPVELGILPGTTQAALFRAAAATGWRTREQPLRISDLFAADGVWLCSSVRLVTRVHTLDGQPLPDAGLTGTLRELLPLPALTQR
ncbi:MAG: aminodeoxychorismate lyase [Pseudonocardiaceae bacterium]